MRTVEYNELNRKSLNIFKAEVMYEVKETYYVLTVQHRKIRNVIR